MGLIQQCLHNKVLFPLSNGWIPVSDTCILSSVSSMSCWKQNLDIAIIESDTVIFLRSAFPPNKDCVQNPLIISDHIAPYAMQCRVRGNHNSLACVNPNGHLRR